MLAQTCWQDVDPRIGSVGVGRTFPGPSMPFGMVKPGPDCGVLPNAGWAPMPEPVLGFSQTHVSGTGGGQKYGNVLIQPYLESTDTSATVAFQKGLPWRMIPQRRATETIALGYYATTFDNGIRTEITTGERCSFYRISFPEAGSLFVDASHFLGKDSVLNLRERQQFVSCDLKVVSDHEVNGYSSVRGGWNNGDAYTVFFTLTTDVPFTAEASCLHFSDKTVNVKIGISYVSTEQARRNIPPHDFETQLSLLRSTWEQQFSKVQISGTDEQRRMFYTALYHTMLMPVDKTGEYPRATSTATSPLTLAHESGGEVVYYDDYYAIWDTYRTSSPLLTLLSPDRQTAIVNSLLNIYALEGYMPDARSGDCNGRTQGGSNAEVVVADAFAKGLDGINYALALDAMLKDATVAPVDDEKEGRGGLAEYNRLGYIPYGIDRAGNRTVEYAFNDWCIAQVARGLGKKAVYKEYMAKSRSWRNLWRKDYEWDGMRGFILPKDAEGHWLDSVPWGRSKVFRPTIPYTPVTKVAPWYLPWWATFFYEATSEEYSLSIPHDVPGLIRACGGKKAFRQRLDRFFDKGYYNVANEPSFLSPCLYHWIGRPDLSSRRVHQIICDNYSDRPDGLPGNDDSGAMSSWLALHMMGLYPNAGSNDYLLTLPLLKDYTMTLANGRKLHVSKTGKGEQLQEVLFNKRKLKHARITHQQLMQGGELEFRAAPAPSKKARRQPRNMADGQADAATEGAKTASYIPKLADLGEIAFTLNRQFRTWPIAYGWDADTLVLVCKKTVYRIPRREVEHSSHFCWLTPQTDGTTYDHVTGTFAFISRDALRSLQSSGTFLYDNITWRLVDQDRDTFHVCADIDGTEMWIEASTALPVVLEMRNNPLGIDWKLQPNYNPENE